MRWFAAATRCHSSLALRAAGPASGRLLASTTSMPASTAASTSGVVSAAVRSTRIGFASACWRQQRQRVGGLGGPPPARLREAAPACLRVRQLADRARGQAARLEHEAGRVDGGGQAQLAGAVLALAAGRRSCDSLAMMPGQRAPDLPEAEQHDVAVRRRASPRRRRSWRAGTPRAPRAARAPRPWRRRRTRCSAPTSPARWRRC